METLSDIDLIKLYRKGNDLALSILIQRHLASVYRFVLRMVGDAALAEDIVQETFLKAWRHLAKFNAAKSFKTWVFSIAKNATIDQVRKKNPIVFSQLEKEDDSNFSDAIPDQQPLADEILERADAASVLADALSKLPLKTRSIILMHDTEDLTFQDIADAVGEPMNTVKSRYRRALDVLRKHLMAVKNL